MVNKATELSKSQPFAQLLVVVLVGAMTASLGMSYLQSGAKAYVNLIGVQRG